MLSVLFSALSVVCVGGDGMFSELMHGMLTRSMREAGLDHLAPGDQPIRPKLRIGVIPGGRYTNDCRGGSKGEGCHGGVP